ncbi:MAG: hypothetical protein ABI411_10350 [Tahibacter sp.]
MRSVFIGLVLSAFLGQAGTAGAAGASASGSVVINGKTIALTQARAWTDGSIGGRPSSIDVVLAEKPLTGLNWWSSADHYSKGEFGVVLRFKAPLAPGVMPNTPALRFAIAESYNIMVYASDFGGWSETGLDKESINGNDISLTNGVVQGKLDWKGTVANPYDDKQTVTAWSATFSLPLEAVGPIPKK